MVLAVAVKNTGKCCLKARFVGTALYGADIICKGQNGIVVATRILHCNLGNRGILASGNVYNFGMQQLLMLFGVDMLNKAFYTALVAKIKLYWLLTTLIAKHYIKTCVKECLLTQSGLYGIKIKHYLVKDSFIGIKAYVKTVAVGFSGLLKGNGNLTVLKLLVILIAVVTVYHNKTL